MSSWNGKKVIVTSDCLIGALDGMNEDGLAISITFGGRKEVGEGFGIPFIIRSVSECCSTVKEAVESLTRIPSHMSYNVTVVDKTGVFKTVFVAPDRTAVVNNDTFTTNHQKSVDWLANALFNRTLERASFLKNLLAKEDLDSKTLTQSFLQKPLYNDRFNKGFGTLYTAVYKPLEGTVQLLWSNSDITQSFDNFTPQKNSVEFDMSIEEPIKPIVARRKKTSFSFNK